MRGAGEQGGLAQLDDKKMKAYLDIVKNVLENGVRKPNRTGTDAITVAGAMFAHDMSTGFPLLTTKKVPFRLISTRIKTHPASQFPRSIDAEQRSNTSRTRPEVSPNRQRHPSRPILPSRSLKRSNFADRYHYCRRSILAHSLRPIAATPSQASNP